MAVELSAIEIAAIARGATNRERCGVTSIYIPKLYGKLRISSLPD